MEFVNGPMAAAGIAGWMFGAVWYGLFSTAWMEASNLTFKQVNTGDKTPYVISLLGSLLTARCLQALFARAGVTDTQDALTTGFAIGTCVVLPWLVNNIMYSMRSRRLILIDGGYAAFGTTVIAGVLSLF